MMKWNKNLCNTRRLEGFDKILEYIQSRTELNAILGLITYRKEETDLKDAIIWKEIYDSYFLIVVSNKTGWQKVFIETDKTIFQCLLDYLRDKYKLSIINSKGTDMAYNGPDFSIKYDILRLIFEFLQNPVNDSSNTDNIFNLFSLIYRSELPLNEAREQITELINEINKSRIISQSPTEELRKDIDEAIERNNMRLNELQESLQLLIKAIELQNNEIQTKQDQILTLRSEVMSLSTEIGKAAKDRNLADVTKFNNLAKNKNLEVESLTNSLSELQKELENLKLQKISYEIEIAKISKDLKEKNKVFKALETIDNYLHLDKRLGELDLIELNDQTILNQNQSEIKNLILQFDDLMTYQLFGREKTWLTQKLIIRKKIKPSQILLAIIQGKSELVELLEKYNCLANLTEVISNLESKGILKKGKFDPIGAKNHLEKCLKLTAEIKKFDEERKALSEVN